MTPPRQRCSMVERSPRKRDSVGPIPTVGSIRLRTSVADHVLGKDETPVQFWSEAPRLLVKLNLDERSPCKREEAGSRPVASSGFRCGSGEITLTALSSGSRF